MTQSATIKVAPKAWVQITNAPVTNIRVNNQGAFAVHLKATADATVPTDLQGSQELGAGATLTADLNLSDLFPQFAGVGVRVWAYNPEDTTFDLSVCHA